MVLANGGVEHTGSFFVRVYETVSLHLHERAANSFLRAQAVFDTVTAGKMAARRRRRPRRSRAAASPCEGVVSSAPGDRPSAILRGDAGAGALPVLKTVSQPHARPKHDALARSKARPRQRARAKPRARPRTPPRGAAAPTTTTTTTTATRRRAAARLGGLRRGRALGRLGRRGRVRLRGSVT